jgi:8-oxo-dGTP pyrophosphatase MutT (NUDIX family)
MLQTTLCFLVKGDEVLLGMKKRRFGVGKWNGVGGKVLEGENIVTAALREIKEEIGVVVAEGDPQLVATLNFNYTDNHDWAQECSVFLISRWEGEPVESEEIKPQWYSRNALPFNDMWIDDPHWLPLVLAGKKIKGSFLFEDKGGSMLNFAVSEIHP